MRERLVGTWVGSFLLRAREKAELLTSALGSPETFGTVYNDQLALRLAVRLCDPTGIFVDVGAHIGSVSAAVLRRHPRSRVIAIEAIPEKAEHLKRKFPEVDVVGRGERVLVETVQAYPG